MNLSLHRSLPGLLLTWSLLFAMPAGAKSAPPPARKLQPVDEATQDASLVRFRAQLQEAVLRRDRAALQQSIAADIRYSFGAEGGRQGFLAHWGLAQPTAGTSKLWGELERVLLLGGAFLNPAEFCAPYVFVRFPQNLDAFEYVAVITPAAAVRAQPTEAAAVLETLHYDIVRRDPQGAAASPGGTPPEWVRVITPTGKSGFVRDRELRSSTDYRACFRKDAGRWVLTTFVAGD